VSLRSLERQIAVKFGVDPDVFVRLVGQESGGNARARSPKGALGLTQLMPTTAKSLGVRDPFNAAENLKGGAKYLRQQLDTFGGDYSKALAAYNAGPGAVQKYKGVPPFAETQNYVKSILGGRNPKAPPSGGSQSRSGASGATATVQDNPQVALALQKLLSAPSDPAPQPASAPPPTANIAQTVLPQGYTPPPQPQVQPSPQSTAVDQLLQVAASIPPSQVKVSGGGGGSAPSSSTTAPSRKGGVANFDGKPVARWIAPILEQARKAGWKGTVNSGYRSVQEQARIYNSGVRPAAKPGQSNHNFTAFPGGAVDVSDAPQLAQILKRMGVKSLQWAGAKDPVHFSHPRNGTY
jgi:hypothetical protein